MCDHVFHKGKKKTPGKFHGKSLRIVECQHSKEHERTGTDRIAETPQAHSETHSSSGSSGGSTCTVTPATDAPRSTSDITEGSSEVRQEKAGESSGEEGAGATKPDNYIQSPGPTRSKNQLHKWFFLPLHL